MNTTTFNYRTQHNLHSMQPLCVHAMRWASSLANGKRVRIEMLKREVRQT